EHVLRAPQPSLAIQQREIGQMIAQPQPVLGNPHHAQPIELVFEIEPVSFSERQPVAFAQAAQGVGKAHFTPNLRRRAPVRQYLPVWTSIAAGYDALMQ